MAHLPTQAITQFHYSARLIVVQPRSQVLSPTRRETLVGSGHVSPRLQTNDLGEGQISVKFVAKKENWQL